MLGTKQLVAGLGHGASEAALHGLGQHVSGERADSAHSYCSVRRYTQQVLFGILGAQIFMYV